MSRYRQVFKCVVLTAAVCVLSGTGCPANPDDVLPVPDPIPGPPGEQGVPGEQGPQGPPGTPGTDANVTAGDGVTVNGGVVALDTAFTDGLYWKLGGNAGTVAGADVIGTSDDQALELHVNGARALRLEPTTRFPNLIGGSSDNVVDAGAGAATIAGGGPSDANDPATGNRVFDDYGTVGGGGNNQAGDPNAGSRFATVGGGDSNTASNFRATVSGGRSNIASGQNSTVSGGSFNMATAGNTAIGGGTSNNASNSRSTIGGGDGNVASGELATVGGGFFNTAGGSSSVIAGGARNETTGGRTTIGGGSDNTAGTGSDATVGGGKNNTASGTAATVPGGEGNSAVGSRSFAAGRRAKANHAGSFVWGDNTFADVASFGDDTFTARASGGVRFYSSTDTTAPAPGVELPAGDSAWTTVSDRAAKENFRKVDGRRILERLAAIPIETWNYKSQNDAVRHIGPMAQDFHAAFGVGHDDKRISTIDTDGVALAAIQGLHQLVREKERELADQRSQNAELSQRVGRLQTDLLAQRDEIEMLQLRLQVIETQVLNGRRTSK